MEDPRVFADVTTVHGIKDFNYLKTRSSRLVWACFVVFCMGAMVYEIRLVVLEYVHTPTATQMVQSPSQSYNYPRVLFCPKNWINASKVAQLNISKPLLVYALSLLPDLVLDSREKAGTIANYTNISRIDTELEEFLDRSGFSNYSDFFLFISKDPEVIGDCDNCKSVGSHLISSGVCVSLHLNPVSASQLIQTSPSFRFVDSPSRTKEEQLLPVYSSTYTTDMVYIAYKLTRDFFCYDPILLNRNFSYVLRIKPVLHERISKHTKPCVSKDEASVTKYSQSDCYIQCDKAYKKQCQQCKFLDNQNVTKVNSTKPYCSTLLNASFLPGNCTDGNREFDDCIMRCQPLCHEWVRSEHRAHENDHDHSLKIFASRFTKPQ